MRGIILTTVAGLLQFASFATATPANQLFERACGGDNCNRALPRGASSGSVDCSSFLRTTIYGCAATATVVTTTTVTSNAAATRTITSTTTSTATFTARSYTTVTAIPTGPNGPMKRQAGCSTSTSAPSSLPSYATACSSAARYSSACSCLGIRPSTVTVNGGAATTITSTSTATVLVTSSATVTTISTSVTFTTTVSTATIQPISGRFRIVLPGGRYVGVGRTDSSDQENDPNNYFLTPVNSMSDAIYVYLTQEGYVQAAYSSQRYHPIFAAYTTTGDDLVHAHPYAWGQYLHCALSNPNQASGALTCTYGADQRFFNLCEDKYIYISNYRKPGPTCAFVDFYAIAG